MIPNFLLFFPETMDCPPSGNQDKQRGRKEKNSARVKQILSIQSYVYSDLAGFERVQARVQFIEDVRLGEWNQKIRDGERSWYADCEIICQLWVNGVFECSNLARRQDEG